MLSTFGELYKRVHKCQAIPNERSKKGTKVPRKPCKPPVNGDRKALLFSHVSLPSAVSVHAAVSLVVVVVVSRSVGRSVVVVVARKISTSEFLDDDVALLSSRSRPRDTGRGRRKTAVRKHRGAHNRAVIFQIT